MTDELEVYPLHLDTLVYLLHQQWLRGYITAVLEDEPPADDDSQIIPTDDGGPQTEAWVKRVAAEIRSMQRQPDGTYVMPSSEQ